jgi:hypothetical protein
VGITCSKSEETARIRELVARNCPMTVIFKKRARGILSGRFVTFLEKIWAK